MTAHDDILVGCMLQSKEEELDSCPFCGGAGRVLEHKFRIPERRHKDCEATYGVECVSCLCKTWQFFKTREEAINAWNKRESAKGIPKGGNLV